MGSAFLNEWSQRHGSTEVTIRTSMCDFTDDYTIACNVFCNIQYSNSSSRLSMPTVQGWELGHFGQGRIVQRKHRPRDASLEEEKNSGGRYVRGTHRHVIRNGGCLFPILEFLHVRIRRNVLGTRMLMLACMRIVFTWPHPINRCWQVVADKRGHSESKPQTFIVSTINGPEVRIMDICLHTPRNSHTCISAIKRVNIFPDFAASILVHCKKSRRTFRCPFKEYLSDVE